ncbi:cation transporter [Micromonospora tulbaghiae]|uniref:cation transporter n=1 Tax=Micromonospora tulbaghiae TaxID=479978 RepID=UPI003715EC36
MTYDEGKQPVAAEGSTKAVVTALVANLGIAVSKFVAAGITGSASMLAEGVHSVADSTGGSGPCRGHRRPRSGGDSTAFAG